LAAAIFAGVLSCRATLLSAEADGGRQTALREVAADRTDLPSQVAMVEARAELELAFRTRRRLDMSPEQEDAYRRPDGSFDIQRRLAEQRNLNPNLVGMDPGGSRRRVTGPAGVAGALLPGAGAFLLAALAYRAGRGRPGAQAQRGTTTAETRSQP
jgi:hypothetical protein